MKRINVFFAGGVIKNKKYIISLFIALFGIVSLFCGTSYAILKEVNSDSNEQVIKTGSVKLKLTENYETINKKISIMGDEEGLLQEETYDFNLKNIGSSPAKYDLKLINEVPSTYTGKVLDTKYIKVGLEINGEEYGPMSLEKIKNIIDSDVIYASEIINYKLRIWLDKSKEEEISKLEDYKAFLKLKIEAEQRPESMDREGEPKTFTYTGNAQEYTVLRDGYYYVELGGAQGGASYQEDNELYEGGKGSITSGYINLKEGEKLYIYVGGAGKRCVCSSSKTCCGENGGYNGGGKSLQYTGGNTYYGSGGGATDVRLVGGTWNDTKSLISRIMVAGGGAGSSNYMGTASSGYSYNGGAGGYLYGSQGYYTRSDRSYTCTGGSQTAGGTGTSGTDSGFGVGAIVSSKYGPGGGGGYYGGGTSETYSCGGSSYISGYAGVNSVKNSTTITHTNATMHYSNKYFLNGKIKEDQTKKDGYAKIIYIGRKPKKVNTKLNNVRYIKDCSGYNSSNNDNHWIELQAIKDGVNIAKGKTVTGTTSQYNDTTRAYSQITDGDITYGNYSMPSSSSTNQCITVDLEETYDLDEVAVWNYFGDSRVYHNTKTYVSSDNKNFTAITEEDTVQTSNGRRITAYDNNINGYVQDNLNLWLDGFSNSGENHLSSTSTWKDLSGKSGNATVTGSSWYKNYLLLDGVDDYATIPYSQTLAPTEFTIDLTFSKQSIVKNSRSVLFVKWFGYTIELNADNTVVFGTRQSTSDFPYLSGGTIQLKKTYNVVATYKDNVESIYINGVLKNRRTNTSSAFSHSNNPLTIGRYQTSSYSNVKINQMKLYGKALTEEEITHNYNYDKQKFNIE